ncbi:MAG: N,N'-diacetylchitobiose phosphorylase [Spirochaetaceae bacterium]|jgi:N,N'-diacetylchitobiose phosphorylase|nr:N,N'-diacetylchitobiose phosphorylase [Spirochaetaceae bacterium]
MRYGYFDNEKREYVIDRIDVPVSWTNYIGVKDLCGVFNHTAGGYLFYKTPEYHRITRFRPNGVPMDRPGHYVYIRDDGDRNSAGKGEDAGGAYWSLSWQPAGKGPGEARYLCRHGLSYIKYQCEYSGIQGEQKLFIPIDDPVELWDIKLKNNSGRRRELSVFGYLEFSYHHIDMDNKNFQMSLYSSGSSCGDGIIEFDPFYESGGEQFFTFAGTYADDYDCLRDKFIGPYRSENNPVAVEQGYCSMSSELGGNHCGALRKSVSLEDGEEVRLVFVLGEGDRAAGEKFREKYSDFKIIDSSFAALAEFWDRKLRQLRVDTPSEAMNTMLNIWNLYQSEINVMFSRFASFIEVGGRTGLGYRDTAQDAMCIPHSNPEKCRSRITELLRGLTSTGYGLHLFQSEWFEEHRPAPFKSPTVVPVPDRKSFVHGLEDTCADDALWLVPAITEYIKETGDLAFTEEIYSYADGGSGTVYEHMTKILDFSASQVGAHGVCKGLRADWNDCLNLGGGESAMVSFLHHWALIHFAGLAEQLGRSGDAEKYRALAEKVRGICERELWDGRWYCRGITSSGRKIGTAANEEGKVFMESNTWAVLSGAASGERGLSAMDAVDEYLYTPYGLKLCSPAYSRPDDEIGFVTRVYKGLKENAAIFSHPNPWAWAAEAILGRGDRAVKFYNALCPCLQNDSIEVRESEPYSYCQFIVGPDHSAFGRARHPFMTGSAGWSYFAATRYILGIRPGYGSLCIDPCIPKNWKGFKAERVWRGAVYEIDVENPRGVSKGAASCALNGKPLAVKDALALIPAQGSGSRNYVKVVMG